jgi:hypothetical protein
MEHKMRLKCFDHNLGHFIKIRSNAILLSTHRSSFKEIGLPSDLFSSKFPGIILCVFLIFPLCAAYPNHHIPLDLNILIISAEE